MVFRAISSYQSSGICLAIALLFSSLGVWLIQGLPEQPISAAFFWTGFFSLVCLGLALYCLYLAFAFFQLSYIFDRNGLQIRWGGLTRRIPIQEIVSIMPADTVPLPAKKCLKLPLPNWWVGTWDKVSFYTTTTLPRSLVVRTTQGDIVISPKDPQAFINAWQLRIPLGPTQVWSHEILRWPFLNLPLWFDPLAWRLGGGAILLYLILLGATLTTYPTWPSTIPIGFNTFGQADVIANREQVVWFLGGGGIILLLNLILGASWYQKERLAAYLLWLIAILVQISLWITIRVIAG